MRKGYVIAVTVIGLVWAVAVCALVSRWLDSVVLFTTPHPDEAHRNAVDTLWLSGVTLAGPVAVALVAKAGGLKGVFTGAWIAAAVLALLLAFPVYQAFGV